MDEKGPGGRNEDFFCVKAWDDKDEHAAYCICGSRLVERKRKCQERG